jgi:hypothetical protein
VQDGLVAHWDGLESSGFGNFKRGEQWIDLVRPDFKTKITLKDGVEWVEDGLKTTKEISIGSIYEPFYLYDFVGELLNPENFTFELGVRFPMLESFQCSLFSWRNYAKDFPCAGPFAILKPWSYLRITGGGYGSYNSDSQSYDIKNHIGTNFAINLTAKYTEQELYVNGELARSAFPFAIFSSAAHRMKLYFQASSPIPCVYRYLRIYSRPLSSEEIAHNEMITRARFGATGEL